MLSDTFVLTERFKTEQGAVSITTDYNFYHIKLITTPRTHDRRPNETTIPGQEGLDGKSIHNDQQKKDRFQQYIEHKDEIHTGPIFKGKTLTGTDKWNTKEEKIQQDFLWALGLEAMHHLTRF